MGAKKKLPLTRVSGPPGVWNQGFVPLWITEKAPVACGKGSAKEEKHWGEGYGAQIVPPRGKT